jgi:hypothetical protein
MRSTREQKEWLQGARNAKAGMSLSQSYKHIHVYDHDLRNAHRQGWVAMQDYQNLKAILEEE